MAYSLAFVARRDVAFSLIGSNILFSLDFLVENRDTLVKLTSSIFRAFRSSRISAFV